DCVPCVLRVRAGQVLRPSHHCAPSFDHIWRPPSAYPIRSTAYGIYITAYTILSTKTLVNPTGKLKARRRGLGDDNERRERQWERRERQWERRERQRERRRASGEYRDRLGAARPAPQRPQAWPQSQANH